MSNKIFVFGSNLAGRHGKGSAKTAADKYLAAYGVGVGPTGHAYAIPTKGYQLEVLPLHVIKRHVNDFIDYASKHPELEFHVVNIGCGLAGYKPAEIAPMFITAPDNCFFSSEFMGIMNDFVGT